MDMSPGSRLLPAGHAKINVFGAFKNVKKRRLSVVSQSRYGVVTLASGGEIHLLFVVNVNRCDWVLRTMNALHVTERETQHLVSRPRIPPNMLWRAGVRARATSGACLCAGIGAT
jgi:hypothetical protein